ncbi:MAG: protein-glutamine gamma-glutamyltransferase, partial [Solirubrobacteraceae bacterium]|nr:protein-glutamine gamma-glutamyltransferase [Solirubrobacteraceae bacterium]
MTGRPGRAQWPLPAATVLIAVAGATGMPAVFALGAGLGLATVGAWAAVLVAARTLRVSRTVQLREVCEDEPLRVRFDVRGASRLPVALYAHDATGAWVALATRGATLAVASGPRGAHQLAPSALRIRDALGIAERRLDAGEPEPILVLPRPEAGSAPPAPHAHSGRDPEPDGLQPYAPGTPIARIHWPSMARGSGLHARRVAAPAGGIPLVVVDTAGGPDRAAVDWTARAAAGEILRLTRAGGCRVLLPG